MRTSFGPSTQLWVCIDSVISRTLQLPGKQLCLRVCFHTAFLLTQLYRCSFIQILQNLFRRGSHQGEKGLPVRSTILFRVRCYLSTMTTIIRHSTLISCAWNFSVWLLLEREGEFTYRVRNTLFLRKLQGKDCDVDKDITCYFSKIYRWKLKAYIMHAA